MKSRVETIDEALSIINTERILTDEETAFGRTYFCKLFILLEEQGYVGNLITSGKMYSDWGAVYVLFDSDYFTSLQALNHLDRLTQKKIKEFYNSGNNI